MIPVKNSLKLKLVKATALGKLDALQKRKYTWAQDGYPLISLIEIMTSRQLLKCLPAMPKRLYGFGIGRSQGVVPKLELVGSRVGGLRLEAFKNRQLQDGRVPGQLRVCVHYARLCPLPPQIWLHGFGP